MLTNVRPIEDLGSLARANSREYETKTVFPSAVPELQQEGWEIAKRNKKSVRLKRAKRHSALLEDRVWTLLYRMKFRYLSDKGGARLQVNTNEESPSSQLDVVALDDEVAIAIECKSSEEIARRPQFQQELGKHSLIRERFTVAARKEFSPPARRLIVLAMFTSNIVLSENDKLRAREANIVLLDDQDLAYYETLVAHIGPAARYQLLAELLPGKTVPNLEIKVPAIRARMGGANCYTFSISPEYLLKIAYVSIRVRAIISKAVQELGSDPESPLAGRVLTADSAKSDLRCITLTSLYSAIGRTEFHLGKARHNVPEYGPLWAGTNEATLKRTVYILKHWFDMIKAAVPDWWDKGAGEGGGLAMNDGVTTCIMVLRSVFQHSEPHRLVRLDNEDLLHYIRKYAEALGAYFARFTDADRKMFRDLRGVQGQTRRWRKCQEALREAIPSFNPDGLDKYLAEEKDETNTRGKSVIEFIEKTLQKIVLDELKSEMPEGEDWWLLGVPKLVRQKVTQKYEDDDHQRGGYEYYFDLIDYPKIALHNWTIFQPILGYGTGGKEKQLSWLNFVNLKRNIVSHASSGKTLTLEELDQLEQYGEWLRQKKGELMDSMHAAAETHEV